MKGLTSNPDYTGTAIPDDTTEVDNSVPAGWPQKVVFAPAGGPPGAPIQWGDDITNETVEAGFGYVGTGTVEEDLRYFYHSDHLGSTSYITDAKGNAVQYIAYMPFGETLAEQHADWDSPFKFNAKELDTETGLYYYGARYYDPKTSVFIGVDPLAEKFTDFSPFAYCMNNPVRLIDPSGMGAKDPQEPPLKQKTEAKQQTPLDIKLPDYTTGNNTPEVKVPMAPVPAPSQTPTQTPKKSKTTPEVKKDNNNGQGGSEADKYGTINSYVIGLTSTVALGGGGTFEFGYVTTTKNYAQYYLTLQTSVGIVAGIGSGAGIIRARNGQNPTFSDWAGRSVSLGAGYGLAGYSLGLNTTYISQALTIGLTTGWSSKVPATGSQGVTFLIGSPINCNPQPTNAPWMICTYSY